MQKEMKCLHDRENCQNCTKLIPSRNCVDCIGMVNFECKLCKPKCKHDIKHANCTHYNENCYSTRICINYSDFECKLCKEENEMDKQAIYRVMINNNGGDWRFYSEKYKSEDEAVRIIIKEIVKGYDMTKFKVVEDIPLNIELIHKGR